jgi:ribosomal protein S18 acetylase RimI-like enzyme
MTHIQIRDFEDDDRAFVIALSGETLRELQDMDSESLPLAFLRDAAEWFETGLRDSWIRRSLFYVAWVEHEPAGYVIAGPTNDPWKPRPGDSRIPQKVAEIYELHVKMGRRRQGVGSALLAAAERELTRQGYTYVTLGHLARNVAAVQLYASKGYRPRWVSEEKRLGASP